MLPPSLPSVVVKFVIVALIKELEETPLVAFTLIRRTIATTCSAPMAFNMVKLVTSILLQAILFRPHMRCG